MGRLFPTGRERQREVERLTAKKDPAIGYALLALLMAHETYGPRLNTVLSTNFDDLVQDALYLVTRTKPLVVAHDSLARYVRHSRTRPLIVKVKVHSDAFLAPRNTEDETRALGRKMRKALEALLDGSGIIFCGYGGNDRSIATLLRTLPEDTLKWGIHWVGKDFPEGQGGVALRERTEGTFHVPQDDFDELMLMVSGKFQLRFSLFVHRLKVLEGRYIKRVEKREKERAKREKAPGLKDDTQISATSSGAQSVSSDISAYRLIFDPRAPGPKGREARYANPASLAVGNTLVQGSYAEFLTTTSHNPRAAEDYLRSAREADPNNAAILSTLAVFLVAIKRTMGRQHTEEMLKEAEELHEKAVSLAGTEAVILRNGAQFLASFRLDRRDEAADLHRRAVAEDPADADILTDYAGRPDLAKALTAVVADGGE